MKHVKCFENYLITWMVFDDILTGPNKALLYIIQIPGVSVRTIHMNSDHFNPTPMENIRLEKTTIEYYLIPNNAKMASKVSETWTDSLKLKNIFVAVFPKLIYLLNKFICPSISHTVTTSGLQHSKSTEQKLHSQTQLPMLMIS